MVGGRCVRLELRLDGAVLLLQLLILLGWTLSGIVVAATCLSQLLVVA